MNTKEFIHRLSITFALAGFLVFAYSCAVIFAALGIDFDPTKARMTSAMIVAAVSLFVGVSASWITIGLNR